MTRVRDKIGNTRLVEISKEALSVCRPGAKGYTYVGSIRAGAPAKMMSGDWRVPLAVVGEGCTIDAAVRDTLARWNERIAVVQV